MSSLVRRSLAVASTAVVLMCGTSAHAQTPPKPGAKADAPAYAVLMRTCPSAASREPRLAGIIVDILGGVLKYTFVKAADLFADSIKKQNAQLNAVTTFEGFGPFYGSTSGSKPRDPARCVVLARFDDDAAVSADFTRRVAGGAADLIAHMPEFGSASQLRTPAFYAEFELLPITASGASNVGVAGFRMAPRLVYFGNTAAARWGSKAAKALRVEIDLKRLTEAGGVAEKPYYSTAFNIGDSVKAGTLSDDFGPSLGPPALFPAPKDLKSAPFYSDQGEPIPGPVVDQALTVVAAKVMEAEDPGFLMKALESVFAAKKKDWETAAGGLADRIIVEIKKVDD